MVPTLTTDKRNNPVISARFWLLFWRQQKVTPRGERYKKIRGRIKPTSFLYVFYIALAWQAFFFPIVVNISVRPSVCHLSFQARQDESKTRFICLFQLLLLYLSQHLFHIHTHNRQSRIPHRKPLHRFLYRACIRDSSQDFHQHVHC